MCGRAALQRTVQPRGTVEQHVAAAEGTMRQSLTDLGLRKTHKGRDFAVPTAPLSNHRHDFKDPAALMSNRRDFKVPTAFSSNLLADTCYTASVPGGCRFDLAGILVAKKQNKSDARLPPF